MSAAAVALSLLLSTTPIAQEEGRPVTAGVRAPAALPAESAQDFDWYGWETLLADGGAALLMLGGLAIPTQDPVPHLAMAGVGIGVFALGGPMVHWRHGRWPTALLDLVLRVGSLVASSLLGFASIDTSYQTHAVLAFGPPVTAILIDALALARSTPDLPKDS